MSPRALGQGYLPAAHTQAPHPSGFCHHGLAFPVLELHRMDLWCTLSGAQPCVHSPTSLRLSLSLREQYSPVGRNDYSFPLDSHLGGFWALSAADEAAPSSLGQGLLWTHAFLSRGEGLGRELRGYRERVGFTQRYLFAPCESVRAPVPTDARFAWPCESRPFC